MDVTGNCYVFSQRKGFKSIFTPIVVGLVLRLSQGPMAWPDYSPPYTTHVLESVFHKGIVSYGSNTDVYKNLRFAFPDTVDLTAEDFPTQSAKFDLAFKPIYELQPENLTMGVELSLPFYAGGAVLSSIRHAKRAMEHGRIRAGRRPCPTDRAALSVQRLLVGGEQIARLSKKTGVG